MTELAGSVAIVTGASSGIGRGLAEMLARHRVRVGLAARRRTELERVAARITAAGGSAVSVPTDVADDAQLHDLVDRVERQLGPVDILVNAAGLPYGKPLHELDIDEWDAALDVNLRGPAVLCARVLPGMRARRRGFIVNICSEAGVFVYPGMGVYAVSKHALRVLTELLQEENQALGIKAWAVCPGMVDTPMSEAHPDAARERFLTVEDVADVVEGLLLQGDNVKLGPQILIRTMQNPWTA
jgi:NAD(P)-dependent dehydrogenase (short-subunit alcohol dehydrogenase family)